MIRNNKECIIKDLENLLVLNETGEESLELSTNTNIKDLLPLQKSPEFCIINVEHARMLCKGLEFSLNKINKLSDKGFINDPDINIPMLDNYLNRLGITKKLSIETNTVFHNLVLLIMYLMVIKIEDWSAKNELYEDYLMDLKNLKSGILRMMHPYITDRITNKGISVTLNTVSGFDSEYELNSLESKTNNLLSIQLACNSYVSIKIPIINTKSVFNVDFNDKLKDKLSTQDSKTVLKYSVFGEGKFDSVFRKGIDEVILEIRKLLFENNDVLINKLIEKFNDSNFSKNILNDSIVYNSPKTDVNKLIKYVSKYSFNDLLEDSYNMQSTELLKSLQNFINTLNGLNGIEGEISSKMNSSLLRCNNQHTSRISYRFGDNNRLSITVNRLQYLCMHESAADLSMLSDFDIIKEELALVSRSFVTLGKPLTLTNLLDDKNQPYKIKSKVHIRDTALIAPAGAKSLANIGKIYGDKYLKVDIGEYRGNMALLLKENKELFEEYALQDAVITLKHANKMEEFNLEVDKIGVPLTLSSISKAHVIKEWIFNKYEGYQMHKDLMIGNLVSKLTPKTARAIELSKFILSYIRGYRGGRNEAFMWGIDIMTNQFGFTRKWFDYDLTGAYTTVMSILGHPDINNAVRIFDKTVKKMSSIDLLLNYIVLDVDFKFNKDVKFPCIPTRVDNDVDIYPLEGRSVITGAEYVVASNIGCTLYVRDGVLIPFKKCPVKKADIEEFLNRSDNDELKKRFYSYVTPYREIVKELQLKRRLHPKKTFYNYMYKEIGNSIYGQIAMGISGKSSYDIKMKTSIKVEGGLLSNPIIATYITGFTRALIGELMHNVHTIGGFIAAVTTDGFISNIDDLENELTSKIKKDNLICLRLYKIAREFLTKFKDTVADTAALEVKNVETLGLIVVKTRGNVGFTEGGISAVTGFQTRHLSKNFHVAEFTRLIEDGIFQLEYIQTSLRSGRDIYKHGGQMVPILKDRKFSLRFDNKRCVIEQPFLIPGQRINNNVFSMITFDCPSLYTKIYTYLNALRIHLNKNLVDDSNKDLVVKKHVFYDSKPWKNERSYTKIRVLHETLNIPLYKGYSNSIANKSYNSFIETSVRGFIKICLNELERSRYGIPNDMFSSYKSLIEFIQLHEPARAVKLSISGISNLKNRNCISRAVPRNKENEAFINHVKNHINNFNSDLFFRELSSESVRNLKKS